MGIDLGERFEPVRALGRGATGEVWLARDRAADMAVAVKLLARERRDSAEARLAFHREFATLRRLAHPRTVAAYDAGVAPGDRPWFTMEPIEGPALEAAAVGKDHAWLEARLAEALEALAFLHRRGWRHGDIKPENMRLRADGALVLMDLGLAGRIGDEGLPIHGTPRYLAPETIRRERLDGRSDLYALGAVFYQLLAGRPPFAEVGARELLRAHLSEPPVDLVQIVPEAPPDLRELIMAMLAKSPLGRPASAADALLTLGRPLTPQAAGLARPPLVGREAELAALEARVMAGTSGATWLTGPAGVGRSRLLDELAARSAMAGHMVVRACAPEGAGTSPGAALAALRRALEAQAGHEAPAALARFAAIVDEPPELEPRAARLRLRGAWLDWLAAIADAGRPPLLLLDDWDRADASSRELLAEVLASGRAPLTAVLVGEADAAAAEPGADELRLAPLDTAAIAELAAGALDQREVAPPFASQLAGRTGGLPALAIAVLERLLADDRLQFDGGEWRTERVVLGEADLPADMAQAAAARLVELPPPARRLGQALAVCRAADVPLASLAGWAGLEPTAAAEAIDALAAVGAIVAGAAGPLPAGPHVAAALAAGAPAELHAAIAAGLESLAPDPALAPAVAQHWLAAGEPARARPYALAGVRWLIARHDTAGAESLLAPLGLDDPEPRALAGDLARLRGDLDAAAAHYTAVLAHRRGARVLGDMALIELMRGRFAEGEALAREAAAAALAAGDSREEARVLATLARLQHLAGDPGADATCVAALDAARAAGDRVSEAEVLGLMGYRHVADPEAAEDGLALLDEALRLREALGDRAGLADATMFLGNAHVALGHYLAALAAFERNLALVREVGGAGTDACTAMINLAQTCGELGRPGEGLGWARAALDEARAHGDRFLEAYALALTGWLHGLAGRLGEALGALDAAAGPAGEVATRYLDLVLAAFRAPVLLACGDGLGALDAARAGLAAAAEAGVAEFRAELAVVAGAACMALGDHGRAAERLAEALDDARARRAGGALARAQLALARLALAERDFGRVRLALLEGREAAQTGGMAAIAAELDLVEAALALGEQRQADAAELARGVLARAAANGLATIEGEAARLLAGLAGGDEAAEAARRARRLTEECVRGLPAGLRASFRRLAEPLAEAQPVLPADLAALTLGEALARLRAPQATRAGDPGDGLIAEFGRVVTGTLRYEEALDRIAERVLAVTGAERAMIMLVDDDGGLSGLVTRPVPPPEEAGGLLAFSRTFAQAALAEKRAIWIGDAQADERFSAAASVMALDLRTVLCVPLLADDQAIGLLYVDQRSVSRTFGEADLRLVEGLAGFAALAIANARRYEEARAHEAVMRAARAIAAASAWGGEDATARVEALVLGEAVAVLGTAGTLLVGEPPRPGPAMDAGGQPIVALAAEDMVARALATARPQLEDRDGFSVLALPLLAERRPIGALLFWAEAAERTLGPREVERLEPLVAQAAGVLDGHLRRQALEARVADLERLVERLQGAHDAGDVDAASGVFNAAFLRARLAAEVAEARRYGRPLALLGLACDGLPELTERFGAATAEAVVKAIAGELAGLARRTDVVAHLGGASFVALLPETDRAGAARLAERAAAIAEAVAICAPDGRELWRPALFVRTTSWRESDGPDDMLAGLGLP